jgi:uroporphyrinogen-III decarboxylase
MSQTDDKLLLKAIRREAVPRRPLWIMRQAGRYLPEYREFRAKHSFKELAGKADLAAEVTLMPLKRYPLDAAIVFADIMSPMPSLGIEFDFDPGPVVANPIRDQAAIERLRRPDPAEIAPEVIEALKLTRAALLEIRRCSASAGRPGHSRRISSKAKVPRTFRCCAPSRLRSRSCSTRYSHGSRASWAST